MNSSLCHLTVMVTRPKPQGEELCKLIQQAGGRAIYFSTLEIAPPKDSITFSQQITALDRYDWLIVVSQHAVYQSAELIHARWPIFPEKLKIAAVGESTAKALQAANLPVHIYPHDNWSSEGLLYLPVFQKMVGKKIALLRGEGGRELLADELIKRGAELTRIIAYHRRLPTLPLQKYRDLLQANEIDIIICASCESMRNLKSLLGEASWPKVWTVPLLVTSQRIATQAEKLGYKTIFLTDHAQHHAILQALERQKDRLCQMHQKNQ